MGSKICMNASCGTATSREWKKGWPLRSGVYADLCYTCGFAYENSTYCDTFHLEEDGWRECYICTKRLHCGCIASHSLLELLDFGGVGCTGCAISFVPPSTRNNAAPKGFGSLALNSANDLRPNPAENRAVGDNLDGRVTQLCRITEANKPNFLHQIHRDDTAASLGQLKRKNIIRPKSEVGMGFSNATQPWVGSSKKVSKLNTRRPLLENVKTDGSLAQTSLSRTLAAPSTASSLDLPFPGVLLGETEQIRAPSIFQQGQRSRPILPKPLKKGLAMSSENKKGVVHELRIARPPGEGRGKTQLLPRYWPRITDQELQQISGDLNSTIVPLFEKVLSASDAGRIGRLVLPKACAEAYFPPINQSEGLPLHIQDVKGKEWTFQFRFWPNNNSRMYVLEGVTPCIQSMQLRAGDTVIFSRLDPGGKLVMGFRKETNSVDTQEAQTSGLPAAALSRATSTSGTVENLSTVNGYSDIYKMPKGNVGPHLYVLPEHLSLAEGDNGWNKYENPGGGTNGGSVQRAAPISEKKRTRNIGSKNKRLLMNSEDALELRLTWEEAQDLLRPPPGVKPSVVTIEDHEFEEYDEPPVFGNRTIFIARPSGGQEQWAHCDDCSKWRRLPMDALLPLKWTCQDNVWDSSRCSCLAPEETSPNDLGDLTRMSKDLKRQRISEKSSNNPSEEREPSGLDALASLAILGDDIDSSDPSAGVTTKHPRHRPGCTCIVCIQPPSGKGKHKPTCTCNVCMTVKRRFKTLALRKKKRQSEMESETSQKELKDELNFDGTPRNELVHSDDTESEENENENRKLSEEGESSAGQIDLNCHPNREEMQIESSELMGMMSLVEAASLPMEKLSNENGLDLASVAFDRENKVDKASGEPNMDSKEL
ncbi:B3 domain-containing transcription repressor VAL1-like [Tripterygium wilfordii]|uniref:B3 domain-containing transcription repressor VAL1-like n=1 Tax=Tripterygium wilfordii TaxID=458696 RepID=UPI0018F7F602|nr:B3 domain-containing transcription repressor VAL1-like [Tripterygium wilfordii]XP_038694707.1 B3 domain-containing transcription repressor VAL1-like [Tripterygium wilfordii]